MPGRACEEGLPAAGEEGGVRSGGAGRWVWGGQGGKRGRKQESPVSGPSEDGRGHTSRAPALVS